MVRKLFCLLLPLYFLASPAAHAACQCADAGDIRTRMTEASAAIAAYSGEIVKLAEQHVRTGQLILFTPDRKAKMQGIVKTAMTQAKASRISATPGDVGENPGGTDDKCDTTVNVGSATSACLRESIVRHEEVHRTECKKTLTAAKLLETMKTKTGRFERDHATMEDYAREEISAYTAELTYLQAEILRLAQSDECKPKPKPRPAPTQQLRDYTAQPRR